MMSMHARVLIFLGVATIAGGTTFFHFIEGWSWLDAYFFTVVTVSTVGYGSLVPITALGKIGTTVLIFLGIGVIAVAINFFGTELVAARTRALAAQREKSRAARNRYNDDATGK